MKHRIARIYSAPIDLNNALVFPFQDEVDEVSVEEVILGLASQLGEREDSVLCSDVRNNLFGPMEFSRRDLAALNIMRGRDNG